MLCLRFAGQFSINQRGESIDEGFGGVGVGEWKEQEQRHGKRLGEAKAPGRGEGCSERVRPSWGEQGEGIYGEGRGVKETDEAIWVKELV